MKRWNKDRDPNTVLIPRDISGKRYRPGLNLRPAATPSSPSPAASERFDVMPMDATSKPATPETPATESPETEAKAAETATTKAAAVKASGKRQTPTGDMKAAFEAQKARKETPVDPDKKKREDEAKKREADAYRTEAQKLLNDIAWWRQQYGNGQHDDATIDGMINDLQYKLGAIPSNYWA